MMKYGYKLRWDLALRNELIKPFSGEPTPEQIQTLNLRQMTNRTRTRTMWVQKLGEVVFNRKRTVAIRLWYPSQADPCWRVEALEKGRPSSRFGLASYPAASISGEDDARDCLARWWQSALRH